MFEDLFMKLAGRLLLVFTLFAGILVPVVLIVLLTGCLPLLAAGLVFVSGSSHTAAMLVLVSGPLFLFTCWWQAKEWVRHEHAIVKAVGPDRALWVADPGRPVAGQLLGQGAKYLVWHGWDNTRPWLDSSGLISLVERFGPAGVTPTDGIAVLASRLWSGMIVSLYDGWSMPVLRLVSVALVVSQFIRVTRGVLSAAWWYWLRILVVFWALLEMPAEYPALAVQWVFKAIFRFTQVLDDGLLEWLQWRLALLVTNILVVTDGFDHSIKRKVSKQLAGDTVTFVAHFREFVVQAVSFVADMKLPEYIRSSGWAPPSVDALMESNELMARLGWPVNVSLNTAPDPIGFKFKDWLLCGSDMKTGVKVMRPLVDENLRALFTAREEYKRTETYSTEENELKATSRYFNETQYDMPDLDVSMVWELVAPIFRESRLTPFNYIIRMWEKKYALGAFMRNPATGKRYARRAFMRDIGGYAPFKALWAKTFYWSTQFVPTASVSIKGEALPARKWMESKVRTIVGSPITQYILSTVWNYGPNHRFSWESTPIKIGMPLNGGTMGQIWANHSRCQIHVEGDFSEFDSTLSGRVKELVAEVRKKGYEHHKDSKRIADLIDVNYKQVNDQLLNTHSNGNVYRKGTGFTTGHSSTSMDNSVALVVLYLMAWKEITGLSAREFKFYNELSCFGDDHFLSILGFHPSGWTPTNIKKTMGRWGVTNNLQVKPLDQVEFLAKFCARPNSQMRAELDSVGLRHITMAVWHNKAKLVGKLTAQVKSLNPTYKAERLVSFLGLTAHHRDVYDGIIKYFNEVPVMKKVLVHNNMKLPSYDKVLRDWYSKTSEQLRTPWFDDEKDEMENTGKIMQYGEVSAIDSLLGTLSLLPDLLNPTIFNYGYHKILQARLKPYISWAYDFIILQNGLVEAGAARFALGKTPYRFMEPELFVLGDSGANMTEMLLRHWAYVFTLKFLPSYRPFALADFVVRKVASLQFAINGKLQSEMATSNPYVLNLLLVALLGLVHVPNWLHPIARVRLPDFNAFLQLVGHLLLVTVWQNVPALYQEVERGLKFHDWSKGPVLVEAATGTGKSTDLPLFLCGRFGHVYDKVVLVVPRTALCVSLVAYLQSISTLHVSGSCEGLTLDRNAKLWVVTATALWQLMGTLPGNCLIVFDEAHIVEDRHQVTRELLNATNAKMIMTTATPSVRNIRECGLHLKLNAANLFSRTDLVVKPVVGKTNLQEVNARLVADLLAVGAKVRPTARCLFFVNSRAQAEAFARAAPRKTGVLVSGTPIDTTFSKQWYVSTTVADVGITIPHLDVVVTPNMSPWGKQVVALSTSLYRQRAGRTGRTNNGVVYLLQYDLELPAMPEHIPVDAGLMATLFPSGLPVQLAHRTWPAETFEALGARGAHLAPVATQRRMLLSAEFLLNRLRPYSQNIREAALASNSLVGEPHVNAPGTVSAAFSRTHPQNADEWDETVLECMAFVLEQGTKVSDAERAGVKVPPMTSWALPDTLSSNPKFSVTGLQKACYTAIQLWYDPATAIKAVADAVPSKTLEEIKAAFEIKEMLG